MKRLIKITGLLLAILFVLYVFLLTSFPFFPERKCRMDQPLLLSTHWKQMGGFQQYAPDSLRLGCWSTALAQIAYYHRLKPFGRVKYTSRQGYIVDEMLDSSSIDFRLFASSIDSGTSDLTITQLAKYNYYAALVVRKDFGTDRYMHKLLPAALLEEHYRVKAARYISWHGLPYTRGKLKKIIYQELNARRPVFLHFANLKDFGHSVVIDGYCYRGNQFMIHTNQGQGGPTDGWYDFDKGILREDDIKLRVVYTMEPLP